MPGRELTIDEVYRYVQEHARILTEYNNQIKELNDDLDEVRRALTKMDIYMARQEERDIQRTADRKALDEYIKASNAELTAKIGGIYKIGFWILTILGGAFLMAVWDVVIKGSAPLA